MADFCWFMWCGNLKEYDGWSWKRMGRTCWKIVIQDDTGSFVLLGRMSLFSWNNRKERVMYVHELLTWLAFMFGATTPILSISISLLNLWKLNTNIYIYIYIYNYMIFVFCTLHIITRCFFDASPGFCGKVSTGFPEVLVDRSCGTLALFGVYSMIGMQVRMMGMMKS